MTYKARDGGFHTREFDLSHMPNPLDQGSPTWCPPEKVGVPCARH